MRKFLAGLILLVTAFVPLPFLTFGANPEAVSISSIAVAGGTATVTTAAAHGLSATLPSGFCIAGSSVSADNVCQVVVTASTSTTFTFPSAVATACASSCGTVAPAPRVVNLSTSSNSNGTYTSNYILWIFTASPVSNNGVTSAWKASATSAGPTSAQNAALAAGYFIEVQRSLVGNSGLTSTALNAYVQQDWTNFQTQLTSGVQPAAYYGYFWDGAAWQLQ